MAQTVQIPQQHALVSSDPPSPPAGYITIFCKTDGHAYIKDSSGTVTQIDNVAGGGGGLTQAQVLARQI